MIIPNQIYLGNCLDIMKEIPDESIDLIFTDPPYNISHKGKIFRDYRTGRHANISMDFGEWDYEFDPIPFLVESLRVLKPTGQWLIFSSEQLYGVYRDWFNGNAYFKQMLLWIKSNPLPEFRKIKYRQSTEIILWSLKNKLPKAEIHFNFLSQEEMKNVYIYPICGGNERKPYKHPTQKPLKLIRDILRRHTSQGDIVLDPYCGVGTISVACREIGLNYIGIEIDKKYFDLASKRLDTVQGRLNV